MDFSYLLGAKPVELPDPLQQAGQMQQLQNAVTSGQASQLQLQRSRREEQEAQLVSQALPELQAGGFTNDTLNRVLNKYGNAVAAPLLKATLEYRKQAAAVEKDSATAAKDRMDVKQRGINIAGNTLSGIANGTVPLNAVSGGYIMAQLRHIGTPDEILQSAPSIMDPKFKDWAATLAAAATNPEQQAQIWQIRQKTPADVAKMMADTNRSNVEAQYAPMDSQSRRISANAAASNAATRRLELNPLGAGAPPTGTGATGDDFLQSLAPNTATTVKAIAEGRMAIPSGAALRSPYWQSIISAVGQYDPSFDAANANSRVATRKDFTSGKSAQSANALNTALGHVESLLEAGNGLHNTGLPIYNKLKNFASQQLAGDPQVNQFEVTKNAVVDEMVRAYRNAGGTEQDIKSWADQLSSASSPEQLNGVASQMVHLLSSKIDAMNDTYRKGMGTTAQGLDLLTPKSRATMQRLGVSHQGADPAARSGLPGPALSGGSSLGPAGKIVKSGSRFAVSTPDGQSFTFPTEGAAFEFASKAGLR